MTRETNSCITATKVNKHIKVGFWGLKKRILEDVSFTVPQGSIVGFVGPNGAGKSTTIKIMLGAMRPSSGSMSILDSDPHDISVKSRVGYLPEIQNLPKTLKPIELLALHSKLSRKSHLTNKDYLIDLLNQVGLAAQTHQPMKGFSKGQQQRVGLALALCHQPELLILDEPMTGLDPIGRSIVRQIILDQKKQGHTVFFSSHILSDVEALCDEVIFIDKGQTQRQGPIDELLQQEQKGYEIIVNITTAKLKTLLPELTAVEIGQSSLINVKSQAEALSVAEKLNAASLHIAKIEETKSNLEDLLIQTLHKDSQTGGPS